MAYRPNVAAIALITTHRIAPTEVVADEGAVRDLARYRTRLPDDPVGLGAAFSGPRRAGRVGRAGSRAGPRGRPAHRRPGRGCRPRGGVLPLHAPTGPQAAAPDPNDFGIDHAVALFTDVSRSTLDGTRRWIALWEPDLVVYGALQGAGAVAAAEFGVPAVEHAISPADVPGEAVAGIWPGVTDRPLVAPRATVGIVPDSFTPGGFSGDRPMRMVPYAGGAVVPDGLLERAERPRVLVTMGTVVPRFGGVAATGTSSRPSSRSPGRSSSAWARIPPGSLSGVPCRRQCRWTGGCR